MSVSTDACTSLLRTRDFGALPGLLFCPMILVLGEFLPPDALTSRLLLNLDFGALVGLALVISELDLKKQV
jgi:hypothetical protein